MCVRRKIMRMRKKIFGKALAALCAAGLILAAAGCADETERIVYRDREPEPSDDSDNTETIEPTYDLGSIVTIDGTDYLVVKNTEKSGNSILGQSPIYHYYPNAKTDAYREQLIEKYPVRKPYVMLFNTENVKTIPTTSSEWEDTYLIMSGGKKHWRIRHRWSNSNSGKVPAATFESIAADDLRQGYDPTGLVIENYAAFYETDLSKKILHFYNWDYDKVDGNYGKTVTYDENLIVKFADYTNYVYVSANQRERNQYMFEDYVTKNRKNYGLRNPYNDNSSTFFQFSVYFEDDTHEKINKYTLTALTKGTILDSTKNSDYQNTLTINLLCYDSDGAYINFNVQPRINNVNGASENFTSLNEAENEKVKNYVTVSDTTKTVNEIEVPEWIMFSVPFAYNKEETPLDKFTKVTFIPQEQGEIVVYVPEAGTDNVPYKFINDFKDSYDIFGEWSPVRPDPSDPSSVPIAKTDTLTTMQNDDNAAADTATKKFTFSGSPLRIELEDMTVNESFVIVDDATASGGKSGLLSNYNSKAQAVITFPAGSYTGHAVFYAPDEDHDAFYLQIGDGHFRVIADTPTTNGYACAKLTPIKVSCDTEVTVRMTISQNSTKYPTSGETGMYIDYVEFTKD